MRRYPYWIHDSSMSRSFTKNILFSNGVNFSNKYLTSSWVEQEQWTDLGTDGASPLASRWEQTSRSRKWVYS